MKGRFYVSSGVRLHYLNWGGVRRPIVPLAGLGDSVHLYRGLASRLATRYQVVGLTRRGHGQSGRSGAVCDLDTFVEDIRGVLDHLRIQQVVLVGYSFARLEMLRFAVRYPQRVSAIVYLDALFPKLDPEPGFSDDPVWSVLPTGSPLAVDLVSRKAYLDFWRRARPAWARIWCEAIEADPMERVRIRDGGRLAFHHDDELMNRIYRSVWPSRDPEYGEIRVPMLAVVPDGSTARVYHQTGPTS